MEPFPISIVQAAFELGFDGVLYDLTDDEVILAAVELSKGNWPEGFSVDRYYAEKIVKAYEQGEAANRT